MMPPRKVWILERRGEFYGGRDDWCSNLNHAVQFYDQLSAQNFATTRFVITEGVTVASRLIQPSQAADTHG